MLNNDFAHLHLHSQYSFLDGAIRIKDLMHKINELKMKQVAITDHGNMFGVLDFYIQAKAFNIKPILGSEMYITAKAEYTSKIRENFHLILLAENNIGYHNLKILSSKSFLYGKYYYPRIDKKLLYQYKEGIIVSSACLGGEIGRHFISNNLDAARNTIREYKNILGPDHYFLEIQPNKLKDQIRYNAFLANVAQDEGLRLNATNDCHYINKEDYDAQNILMAIRQQKSLSYNSMMQHITDDFYVRSEKEMFDLLKDDYLQGFEVACEIGSRCNVNLSIGKIYLPYFDISNSCSSISKYLQYLSFRGLNLRFKEFNYDFDEYEYNFRLNNELNIILNMGFAGYFLIVQDFVNWAKSRNIRVGPGRGSGAGSLVAFALGITDVDPIPYNLLFERFLNAERVSMADFDVDFMQERRSEVIEYVMKKYGKDNVGHIATYSTLHTKSVIKDVARVLDIPFVEINGLIIDIPFYINGKKPSFIEAVNCAPKLKLKAKIDKNYARMLHVASVLEGLYRQIGMHAGGMVIGKKKLIYYVPLCAGNNNELVTQFDKEKVELAGLVKFDFLGLKTLDVISQAELFVNKRINLENNLSLNLKKKCYKMHPHAKFVDEKITILNVSLLSFNNTNVYKLISSGNTLGIFQMESYGFKDLCCKLQPSSFEDIVAAVALYRPGPMKSGMVDDFIARKHHKKEIFYDHPLLKKILDTSYGTIIYQEQIMRIAQDLAGCTLSEADILRRAMSKKNVKEMKTQRKIFIDGALRRDISYEKANNIFNAIEKFASYGFNKSHSVAYAMLTYQTAYLKCFYPVEFISSLLTVFKYSVNDLVQYVNDARLHGIKVLPPNVNISKVGFSVEYDYKFINNRKKYANIRFGLGAIKGLGDIAITSIIHNRDKYKFENILHFCSIIEEKKINKKSLEAIIKSGGMDSFNNTRNYMFNAIEDVLKNASLINNEQKCGQMNIFNIMDKNIVNYHKQLSNDNVLEWHINDKLKYEKEFLGVYLSGHPLDKYKMIIKDLLLISSNYINVLDEGMIVNMMGIVVAKKEKKLKKNNYKWSVVTLEDYCGQVDILCFHNIYHKRKKIIQSDQVLFITGKIVCNNLNYEVQNSVKKIILTKVISMDDMIKKRFCIVNIIILINYQYVKLVYLLNAVLQICLKYKGYNKVYFIFKKAYDDDTLFRYKSHMCIMFNKDFLNTINSLSKYIKVVLVSPDFSC